MFPRISFLMTLERTGWDIPDTLDDWLPRILENGCSQEQCGDIVGDFGEEVVSLFPKFLPAPISIPSWNLSSDKDKNTREHMFCETAESVLLDLYKNTDEELLHILIRILDNYTNIKEDTEKRHLLPVYIAECTEALGIERCELVDAIFRFPGEILLSLLVDFMKLDVYSDNTEPSHSRGPTAHFKRGKELGFHTERALHRRLTLKAKALQALEQPEKLLIHDTSNSASIGQKKVLTKGKDHVRFDLPAPTSANLGRNQCLPVTELPEWTRDAFGSITYLNTIQSKVFCTAYETDENMLVCAPTGAGKTLIALLVILRQMKHSRKMDENFLNDFKVVYLAPMKALVSEMVDNFSSRLKRYGIVVKELTGDMQLTKKQIEETQIIVSTPEKWDVITRKTSDNPFLSILRVLILDEVHLLNDERGPVLESIVARTLRLGDIGDAEVRIAALSATLPNYEDVARFLRVDSSMHLHVFGPEYRPVPLSTSYIGIHSSLPEQEKRRVMERIT